MKKNILHFAIVGGLLTSFGASFDVWWHVSIGRDSFFVLPHLFVYSGVFIMLASSFWAWKKQARLVWKRIFLTLMLIPASLPLDELWHHFRGKESVDSILIIWNPPHVMLFISAIMALGMISKMLRQEKNLAAREVFGAMLLASLLNLMFILAGPFFPFSPFAVVGFYGAAVASLIMTWVFFYARHLFPLAAPAVLVAVFSVILQSVFADSGIVYGSRAIGKIPYLPSWILVLSQITSAVMVDEKFIKNYIVRGLGAGLAGGLVLYAFPLSFMDPVFRYGVPTAMIAVISAGLGGALAGYLHHNKAR